MNHILPHRRHSLLSVGLLTLSVAAMFFAVAPQARAANDVSMGLTLQDTDGNGELDRIVLEIDNDAADTWVVNGTPGFTITQGGAGVTVDAVAISGAATADPVIVNIDLDEATTDVDTDGVNSNAVEVVYVQAGGGAGCTNCIRDAAAELTAIATGDTGASDTEVDEMEPRIVSQTPVSGSGVTNSSNVVIVFSEAIDTATDSIAISPAAAFTGTWSVSDTTFTMNPDGLLTSGSKTITVTTAADVAAVPNDFGGAIAGTTVHPWSFNVASSSSGSSGSSVEETPVTYDIDITSPYIVQEYEAGTDLEITWDYEGNQSMSNVNLYYSIDSGSTYTLIVKNAVNNGRYSWRLPMVNTDYAYLKIEGTDLVTVLATDVSSQFQISTGVVDEDEDGEPVEVEDNSGGPSTGLSPVTGEVEAISAVAVGDYIMSPYFDTVYYVDTGMVRRPFVDSQTYFTYEDSFAEVKTVTDATLPTLPLGSPMLPKAGVVLVKIMSDDRVFAAVNDGLGNVELRWVASEEVAIDVYGEDWADYVIDIPVTLFGKYTMGVDITEDMQVDLDYMKTRSEVNS